jgi:hypothetical protein
MSDYNCIDVMREARSAMVRWRSDHQPRSFHHLARKSSGIVESKPDDFQSRMRPGPLSADFLGQKNQKPTLAIPAECTRAPTPK